MIYTPNHIKGSAHTLWYNGGQTKLMKDTGKLTSSHQIYMYVFGIDLCCI